MSSSSLCQAKAYSDGAPWSHSRRHLLGLTLTAAGGLLLAACGGSTMATTGTQATATATSATSPTAPPTATTGGTAPPVATASLPTPAVAATAAGQNGSATTTAVQKVNANTASQAELTQAFRAAGIANPDKWAREVVEYRPYPTNDPTFAKLRGELAKYNPGPGVVEQIIAPLSL